MIRTGRSLARLLRGSRRWLAVSAVLTVLQSALLVPIGLILRHVLDRTIPEDRVGSLVASGVLILTLSLGSAALGLLTRYLVLAATKSAVSRVRIALIARLQALPTAWLDRREIGELHSIIVQDSERADAMFNAIANQLVPAAIIAGALCAALAVINPLLFLLLTAIVPFMLLGSHRLGNLMRRRTRAWVRAFDHFSTRMHFALRAHTLVRTHSAEPRELEAATAEIEGLSLAGRSMAWTQNAYAQANGTLAVVGGLVVLVVGGAAVAHGSMTLGSLLAFYALVVFLRGQTSIVLAAAPLVISGSESLARLEAILDSDETEPYTGARPLAFGGSIALCDVHFEYREGVPVLQGVDLDISRGERVALVGPNGSGKSTIAGLILGLYRPRRGAVLADGVPFDEVDMRALRRRIAIVQQDPFLFPGTIAQNIAYGAPDADEEAVRTAARRATADDFIVTLPGGYDTPVGDAGTLLSGGQRQRIAIARSLVREPRLLILDEPTSSLDRRAVSALLARLRDLPRQPAVLIISHDPEIVAEADRVYAIEAGVAQPLATDAESVRMSG